MPDGAVYVGRPTKWGNPFAVGDFGRLESLSWFANTARGFWGPDAEPTTDSDLDLIYSLHKDWLKRIGGHPVEAARFELAGKDLACWCPLDEPCHADVLLEIANRGHS